MKALEALDFVYGELPLGKITDKTAGAYDLIRESLQFMQWRKIDDKAKDGNWYTFALQVHRNTIGNCHWEYYTLSMDEDGYLRDMSDDYFDAWRYEDFTHYKPASAPPQGDE